MIKSPEEIRHLSRINLATAKAITVAFEIANPGDTEKEIVQNMITLALGARATLNESQRKR